MAATAVIYHGKWIDFGWGYYAQRAIFSFPYVAMGYLAKQRNIPLVFEKGNMGQRIGICFVLVILYVSLCLMNGRVGIHSGRFGESVILYYMVAVLGSLAAYNIFGLIKGSNKFVTTISTGTIIVLCTHQSFIKVFCSFYPNSYIITIVIMMISYPLCRFFTHYNLYWFTGVNRNNKRS